MRTVDPKAPPAEVLAAVNLASVWLSGHETTMQSYCAGFSCGILAAMECLGVDLKSLDPEILGPDEAAADRKLVAGAVSVIDQYELAMERSMVVEETNKELMSRRAEFTKGAMEEYTEFVSRTRSQN
jgi:hypothetical protein